MAPLMRIFIVARLFHNVGLSRHMSCRDLCARKSTQGGKDQESALSRKEIEILSFIVSLAPPFLALSLGSVGDCPARRMQSEAGKQESWKVNKTAAKAIFINI